MGIVGQRAAACVISVHELSPAERPGCGGRMEGGCPDNNWTDATVLADTLRGY
jgi:hypothetical protein